MSYVNDQKIMQLAHVIFYGKVQGVYFRSNTQFKAKELGLVGSVRNLEDGRVEAFIQGPKEHIDELIEWCSSSIPLSKVIRKDAHYMDSCEEYRDFSILR